MARSISSVVDIDVLDIHASFYPLVGARELSRAEPYSSYKALPDKIIIKTTGCHYKGVGNSMH
jgi:hypothetical protein